ncbi:MAG: septum formation initiator family protein [Eubacteriales bacterium]|nr:septum formation initiator family protein [Eubacteriales bacterium]
MSAYSERLRKAKKRTAAQLVSRVTLAMVLILLLAIAGSTYIRQDRELERLKREQVVLDRAIKQLEAEAYDLEEQKAQAGSEEFLERVARDKLGLVKADELIFID